MELQRVDHCENCKLHFVQNGIKCSLTNKKPEYNFNCPSFVFSENFIDRLKLANLNYAALKRTQWQKQLVLYGILTLGFGLISYGFYLFYLFPIDAFMTVLLSTGIFAILKAGNSYFDFLSDLKQAKFQLDKINEVARINNFNYKIKMDFSKHHGISVSDAEIEYL